MKSYPKGSKYVSTRASRPRKRTFHGNQFSGRKSESEEQNTSAKEVSSVSIEDVHYNPLHGYRFIEFFTVFTALSDLLICRECKLAVKFEEAGNRGLGFKIVLLCRCGRRDINSGPLIHTGYEVNRRIVFVMRLLGIGREGINLFCNLMDICDGMSEVSYNIIIEHVYFATKSVFQACCKKAVDEEKKENEKQDRPVLNLKVFGDSSWKKHFFKSLYGVTSFIGYYSGKVIDFIIKRSCCQDCTSWKNKQNTAEYQEWYEEHKEVCQNNHESSAGKMEIGSTTEMFLRSEELFGVKYGNYIGNGDSQTFHAISDIKPYGDDFQVVKNECIDHIEKRMANSLRKVNKDHKLTEDIIKKISLYYSLAIRRNINSIEGMKKAVMAIYFHMCSTDDNPKHENCPPGADSWCKWRKAEASGENFIHPAPLQLDVQEYILPIFEDLSREDLLKRYLGGHTQNPNESLFSTVWNLVPEHLHSGMKFIEIAAYIAAGLFNEGYASILEAMNTLEIIIGRQCKTYADKMNEQRLAQEDRRSSLSTKEARKARREQRIEQNVLFESTEGLLYGPCIDN